MNAEFIFVMRLFLKDASDEEKLALIPLLGSLLSSKDAELHDVNVLLSLQQLADDRNKDVSKTAALTLVRLGYFPGTDSMPLSVPDFDAWSSIGPGAKGAVGAEKTNDSRGSTLRHIKARQAMAGAGPSPQP